MLQSEAIKTMHEAALYCQKQFDSLRLVTKIEIDYMDKTLTPVSSDNASYVFVSLVIAASGSSDEYSMSLGAEIKHGCVDEATLERDIADYVSMTEEVYERLSQSDNVSDEIRALTKETSDDYSSFLESFPMSDKRNKRTVLMLTAAVIFAALAIVLVTVMALGA